MMSTWTWMLTCRRVDPRMSRLALLSKKSGSHRYLDLWGTQTEDTERVNETDREKERKKEMREKQTNKHATHC